MRIHRIALPLIVGVCAVIVLLTLLNPEKPARAEWQGNWFWKDGGWLDYAPNGMPDFDQKQNGWHVWPPFGPPPPWVKWTYCGPAAVANSLWWFDSKFEPSPKPPTTTNDNYFLVTQYPFGSRDDHDPPNVGGMVPVGVPGPFGLIDELAWYFDTDSRRTTMVPWPPIPGPPPLWLGTNIKDMFYGLQWFLYGSPNPTWPPPAFPLLPHKGSYYDEYHVQMVKQPTWEWVVEEVERSEDVVLLIGFWQFDPNPPGNWYRLGGHYVTVAGINATNPAIALSDPFLDSAEAGGPGRVLSGNIITPHLHPPLPGPQFIHNDAGNVSHDVYSVTLAAVSPGGLWEIVGYPYIPNFDYQNVPNEYKGMFGTGTSPIFVEVEYALAMSPFTWKPGGEWVYSYYGDEWDWEWWAYEDDSDSCMPDFGLGGAGLWYNDGPTSVANSFWWFDSKAETLKTGGLPKPPPVITDSYDLVISYGVDDGITLWDDHAITNTNELIEDLSDNMFTDPSTGTSIAGMVAGVSSFLEDQGVEGDFYTKTQSAPTFDWVADEVEACEDVVMLLGFYEKVGSNWERKGGHWVNAAGVNKDSELVGLSDPALDNANSPSISYTLHLGRVFPPEHLGTVFTPTEKQMPQKISHDIYAAVNSPVAGADWALMGYPATSIITHYLGLNGGGSGIWADDPISTVVEWAMAVSPFSDLVITKTTVITEIVANGPITYPIHYVIEYANTGLAAVENVTITDDLPLEILTHVSYTADPPLSATVGLTYTWTLPKLSYGQHGVITITGELLDEPFRGIYTNTVTITTASNERSPTNNHDSVAFWVNTFRKVFLPLVRK